MVSMYERFYSRQIPFFIFQSTRKETKTQGETHRPIPESFGLILQNRKLICVIGPVQSYLGFWGERLNFGITVVEIQPKVWERRRKRWREKMLNFGNGDTEFPLPPLLSVRGVPKVTRKKKKIDKRIVVMPLSK